MDDALSRNWWAVMVRGVLALGFGFITWARPGATLTILILLFAGYALNDGIFAIVSAVGAAKRNQRWWTIAVEGVFGIVIGLIALLRPQTAAMAVFLMIGVWAIITGVLELVAAYRLRKEIRGEWLMATSGVVRLIFGVVLLIRPGEGAQALMWWLSAYLVAYGFIQLGLSLKLKQHLREEQISRPQPA